MQKVMERHADVYLKAYVALREVDGDTMPVDLVSTSEDKVDAETELQLATDYFRELVVGAGKTF